MRSSRDCAEKLATTRSRSSCTVMFDVSITRSAASRSDSSTARSFDIPSSTLSARGCFRFVASNRLMSTSSEAVRNTIRYSMPRRARSRNVRRDDGSDLFLARLKDTAHRAERAKELSFALRPDPRDAVEGTLGRLPAPKRPVVRDREAVGFVPDVLQEIQRVGAARDPDGLGLARKVDLLEPLREPDGVDVRQAQPGEHVERGVQLPLPAVDHDQVRRVAELRRLLARLLALDLV